MFYNLRKSEKSMMRKITNFLYPNPPRFTVCGCDAQEIYHPHSLNDVIRTSQIMNKYSAQDITDDSPPYIQLLTVKTATRPSLGCQEGPLLGAENSWRKFRCYEFALATSMPLLALLPLLDDELFLFLLASAAAACRRFNCFLCSFSIASSVRFSRTT